MTPAVNAARNAGINYEIHRYEHDPGNRSYGLEAAEKLRVTPDRVFKTLVVELDGDALCIAIISANELLHMKRLAQAAGAKRAAMAAAEAVERSTGYVPGGVSPLGQKRRMPTFVDASVTTFETVYVSAGKRGLDMELAPADLIRLTQGQVAILC